MRDHHGHRIWTRAEKATLDAAAHYQSRVVLLSDGRIHVTYAIGTRTCFLVATDVYAAAVQILWEAGK